MKYQDFGINKYKFLLIMYVFHPLLYHKTPMNIF